MGRGSAETRQVLATRARPGLDEVWLARAERHAAGGAWMPDDEAQRFLLVGDHFAPDLPPFAVFFPTVEDAFRQVLRMHDEHGLPVNWGVLDLGATLDDPEHEVAVEMDIDITPFEWDYRGSRKPLIARRDALLQNVERVLGGHAFTPANLATERAGSAVGARIVILITGLPHGGPVKLHTVAPLADMDIRQDHFALTLLGGNRSWTRYQVYDLATEPPELLSRLVLRANVDGQTIEVTEAPQGLFPQSA